MSEESERENGRANTSKDEHRGMVVTGTFDLWIRDDGDEVGCGMRVALERRKSHARDRDVEREEDETASVVQCCPRLQALHKDLHEKAL